MMIEQIEVKGKLVLCIENEKEVTRNDVIQFANSEYLSIKNTETISSGAFTNFTSLTKVIFKKVKRIGTEAFRECVNLEIVGFNEVNIINQRAFYGCSKIRELIFPSSLTLIDAQAFRGCESLSEINFSYEIKELIIGSKAFAIDNKAGFNDEIISRVLFPPNLLSLGELVFEGKTIEALDIFVGRRGHSTRAFDSMECKKLALCRTESAPFYEYDFFSVPDADFIWDIVSEEGYNA